MTCFCSQLATVLMILLDYGTPIIMSGYDFTNPNQGPPASKLQRLKHVGTKPPLPCAYGWTCEHRDRMISNFARLSDLTKCNIIKSNFSLI